MNIIVEKPTRVEVPEWLWREVRLGGSKEVKITLPDEEDEAEEEQEPEPQPAADTQAEENEKKRLAEVERLQKEKLAAEEAENETKRKEQLAIEEADKEQKRKEKLAAEEAEKDRKLKEKLAAEEAEKLRKQKEKDLAEQQRKEKELQEQAKRAKEAAEAERIRKEREEREKAERLRKEAEAQREMQERFNKQAAESKPAGKTKKVEIQFQDEDEEDNPDLIADDEGPAEPGQQDQQEPAEEQPQTQPAGKPAEPAAAKANRRSFHFQDEEGEEQEEQEEEQEEAEMEEEAEKESNILLLNALTSNALIEEKKAEIVDKSDQRKASALGALFVLTLIGSIVLWIILFRLLAVKNARLGNVVLDIPTLGIYYPTYARFYDAYNLNTDQMQAAMAQLGSEAQAPSEKRQQLLSFFTKKAELTKALGAVKERLSELSKGGRNLADEDAPRATLGELMARVDAALLALREETSNTGGLGQRFRDFYTAVLRDVTKIYADSLDMIDKYGEFYVMTNRIWVASENIFRVFENRALEVLDEMTRHHYEPIRLEKDRVALSRTQFLASARVQELPAVTVQSDKPAVLVCRASTEVDNNDFSQLDRNFELSLVLNNEQSATRSPFKYKVTGRQDRFEFVNVLPLPAGTSELALFALVELGDIRLANFRAFCVKFSDYAHLPEYRDFRLT